MTAAHTPVASGERDSVTGTAVGSLAPGFSVSQTERTVDGKGRGLASTQCLPSGDDFWFVGAASRLGDQASLILTNPESAVATVNVDLYGKRGPIDAPGGRGVQVQAALARRVVAWPNWLLVSPSSPSTCRCRSDDCRLR